MTNNNDSKKVKVLTKALTILSVLQDSKEGIGLTEISNKANINKATCHRILYTLMSDNVVDEGEKLGTYRLGLRLLELGSIVQNRIDLRQKALPEISKLAEQTEETAFLCIVNNNKSMCIERIEGKHVQILSMKVGGVWPLYLGAASRTLLAGLPDEKVSEILSEPIVPRTSETSTDPEVFKQMVREIREKGHSVCHEDFTAGIVSIGAPVYNHFGQVVAAISLSTIVQRITPDREADLIRLVKNAASTISKTLGYNAKTTSFPPPQK